MSGLRVEVANALSDWKILYRDRLDQDRISRSIPSKEAALKQASDLYRKQRAELYSIEGPNGQGFPRCPR